MNIKVNKKFVSLMLAGALGFTLCSCGKADEEVILDSYSIDEVMSEIEDETLVDEVFEDNYFTRVNPFTMEEENTMDLDETCAYLERVVELSKKLNEMGIPMLPEDDEDYDMVTDHASTWTIDDAYDFINDYYFNDEGMKKVATKRLQYYKTFLDKELRVNGIDMAYFVLDNSIKGVVIDANEGAINDTDDIVITNKYVTYYDQKEKFYDTEALDYLDNLNNIKGNKEEFDTLMDFVGCTTLIDTCLDKSKSIIYYGGTLDNEGNIKIKK